MKNKLLILLIALFLINFKLIAQNLVPNPGFEEHTNCANVPNSSIPDEMAYSIEWYSYKGTPDYYNFCNTGYLVKPPFCELGYQFPHKGNAFAGLITYSYSQDSREYIGCQLISPLVAGQKYFISFYINKSGSNMSNYSVNNFGLKFCDQPYSYSNPAPVDNDPHFYFGDVVYDTLKWTKVTGWYIPYYNHTYVMFGNFFCDSLTTVIPNNNLYSTYAYYYIDDICVTTDSLYAETWLGIGETPKNENINVITVYPNPCNKEINISLNNNNYETVTLSIIDITGNTVAQLITNNNNYLYNTEKLAKGLYLLKAESISGVSVVKFNKE